ncbi:MAG TPA: Spy/CpxP family protein refolding chaperone [Longimicrobiaceae bacterium]|nr:Spy/CpxP family protein refolding chaperone [Longimicrobiaceae bacterium]
MKLRHLSLALLLLGAAPPARAAAQSSAPAVEPQHAPRHGPVQRLLRDRDRLGLTDDQVARLQEIDRAMEEQNRPFVAQLLELRRELKVQPWFPRPPEEMTAEQRAFAHEHFERARPLLQKIRENNRAAMTRVGQVLTGAQRAQLREMLHERRKHHEHHDEHDADHPDRG